MGTRSITHVHEMEELGGKIVCSFYRHWDGNPSGHGQDLADWLKDKMLVNGKTTSFVEGRDFNRAGTMAVKLMNHMQDISGCEVIPTGGSGRGEEYTYHIYFDSGGFILQVSNLAFKASDYDGKVIEKYFGMDEEDLSLEGKKEVIDKITESNIQTL